MLKTNFYRNGPCTKKHAHADTLSFGPCVWNENANIKAYTHKWIHHHWGIRSNDMYCHCQNVVNSWMKKVEKERTKFKLNCGSILGLPWYDLYFVFISFRVLGVSPEEILFVMSHHSNASYMSLKTVNYTKITGISIKNKWQTLIKFGYVVYNISLKKVRFFLGQPS